MIGTNPTKDEMLRMGWKASCILISERDPLHLGKMPRHNQEWARRMITDLGLGRYRSRGMTTFEEGIYPKTLVIGAYEGAAIIGHPNVANACLEPRADPLTARILSVFPQAAVLRVGLHSVVNLWSYAYFERGRLLRAFGGSADDGVALDQGDLLAEEQPHFERSAVCDGQRFFYKEIHGQIEEFRASAFGESLVFEVMSRFIGCRVDRVTEDFHPTEFPIERFERESGRRWWRLFWKR
jgi:hypothetical protein